MTSFVRTIRWKETPKHIEEILGRHNHFIPLKGMPARAKPGDFIYLAYRGRIIGRAVIDWLERVDWVVHIGSDRREYPAKCLVHYRGGWQDPERFVPFRGCQNIRYLDKMKLEHLDLEEWSRVEDL